jgi:transcriptional regulator with XRE-family HTH domain
MMSEFIINQVPCTHCKGIGVLELKSLTFEQRLKLLRAGDPTTKIARIMGTSRANYNHIESGEQPCYGMRRENAFERLKLLADYYNIPVSALQKNLLFLEKTI